MVKFRLPKVRFPKLVTVREETGQKQFIGLTGKEWALSTGALCSLYAVLAVFFTILLVIAQGIRNSGDYLVVPGTQSLDEE